MKHLKCSCVIIFKRILIRSHFKIPLGLEEIHHEVELGVVIGSLCKRVSKEQSMIHVAGYVLALDMTAREFQVNLCLN